MVHAHHALLPLVISRVACHCGAFAPPPIDAGSTTRRNPPFPLRVALNEDIGDGRLDDLPSHHDGGADAAPLALRLEARASSGVGSAELPAVLSAVASVGAEYGVPLDVGNVQCRDAPTRLASVPGASGRAVLFRIHGATKDFDVDEDERMVQLKVESSERIDRLMHQERGGGQPILLAFAADDITLDDAIAKEVADYGLTDAVYREESTQDEDVGSFIPSAHVEIDGAMIETVDSPGQTHFDTSSVLVLDNLLDDSLRRMLLNVVKGHAENSSDDDWNDIANGPDPSRWVRGGLMDVVDESSNITEEDSDGSCWGLTDEAIMDICYNEHPAIAEVESKLSRLFPDFIVSRLPEAVLGGCVSPLTANAPTHGDQFDYHIDADPLQVPPSPWADVFGRYPNRSRGKPRFVSCLLYLNDEWDAERWGAPTRFLDPPTQETYEVYPKPGRCVIMDQDVSHTVVAPNAEAGKRPRYSLVWKLILHPKEAGQDMTDLSCGRKWPESIVIGSANKE